LCQVAVKPTCHPLSYEFVIRSQSLCPTILTIHHRCLAIELSQVPSRSFCPLSQHSSAYIMPFVIFRLCLAFIHGAIHCLVPMVPFFLHVVIYYYWGPSPILQHPLNHNPAIPNLPRAIIIVPTLYHDPSPNL
jgi:hypothetical protein